MRKLRELVVSPDFTMDDIQRIREYHAEREQLIGKEAFWAEIKAAASSVQEEIKELRRIRDTVAV